MFRSNKAIEIQPEDGVPAGGSLDSSLSVDRKQQWNFLHILVSSSLPYRESTEKVLKVPKCSHPLAHFQQLCIMA